MNTFKDLYEFINLAKNNRKYAASTANNLKSAVKIFEKELTSNERDSIDIVEQNIEEIFVNVINKNKDKNINSLGAYKARLLKVIEDYKRYGKNPSRMQNWIARHRHSTPMVKNQDKQDKNKINLSAHTPNPVDNEGRIEITVQANSRIVILLSKNPSKKEITLRIQ
ncbi:MAG: hypothetical protein NT026_00905 [Candidatus Staskawiczbacteria bacterium]|nr:hypothetical protein [Candidatus Staskawiczbacteria bacterium]